MVKAILIVYTSCVRRCLCQWKITKSIFWCELHCQTHCRSACFHSTSNPLEAFAYGALCVLSSILKSAFSFIFFFCWPPFFSPQFCCLFFCVSFYHFPFQFFGWFEAAKASPQLRMGGDDGDRFDMDYSSCRSFRDVANYYLCFSIFADGIKSIEKSFGAKWLDACNCQAWRSGITSWRNIAQWYDPN